MFDADTEALIDKLIDGELTKTERHRLEELASRQPALVQRLEDDAAVCSRLRAVSSANFSRGFVGRVLEDVLYEEALTSLLVQTKAERFSPMFVERVLSLLDVEELRKRSAGGSDLVDVLVKVFPRITMPVAVVAVFAIALNIAASPAGTPFLDALVGLHRVGTLDFGFMIVGQEAATP